MQENQELPKGWEVVSLESIAQINPRTAHQLEDTALVSFIPMQCVEEESGKVDTSTERPLLEVKKGYTQFIDGDIIFAKITPCMENGKVAVVNDLTNGIGYGSTEFHVVRLVEGIEAKYVFYRLVSQAFRNEAQHNMTGSAGQKRVPTDFLKRASIALPPLPEQRRIVVKLEELFSRLDAGVATLRQTQAQLKRYRQSVLHAAVTGELTRAWRATHPEPAESGAALLERIRAERRAQWEAAQLSKRGGQLSLGDAWKKKYEEPAAPDTSELPELPQGWVWASVAELATNVQYGSSAKTNEDDTGIPVYRMGNIVEGKLKTDNFKYLPQQHSEFPELLLESGDLLFNRTNSAELVGKSAVYKGIPAKASFASYLIRVQLNKSANSDLLAYTLNSLYGKSWVKSVVTQQVGQANVNGTKLQAFAVPLPPIPEQEQIVSEVERLFSVLDSLELTLAAELIRAERLRQSILHRAFTGRLVPQDAADEPAAALLARLQDAPAAQPAAKAKRGRKAKAADEQLSIDL
ncbi:restriction endonuclease subunit S [Hymenobacter sp. BT635]|uniref:Restriction endonuclease subunit S n=1 Tax=Hymenobacter nitidus TaxID=2880929 RepID=A0ABS8ABG3_9BACT|nr:restriction endonuclease subunit S [Hymenobacter nitidus]MCB2377226.1 restriction endonuclease subunit S [Hymenobacter nitidus]